MILPHFLQHYSFVDRIVVFDNQSDDSSLEILKSTPKVEVRSFDTGGKQHTGKLDRIRNQAWKESKGQADLVIVCDMDEFLYHPNLPDLLEAMKTSGATVLKPQGYEMLGERPPKANEDLVALYPKGARTYSFDKCVLFDPNAIEEIGYQPGSHVCEPKGRVHLFRRPDLFLLHYRHLGEGYVRQRYEACAERSSEFNKRRHLGTHYFESGKKTHQRFEKMKQEAREVFTQEGQPLGLEALMQVPLDFDQSLQGAKKALKEGELNLAVEKLEYILSYDPVQLEALTNLSVILNKTGQSMNAGYALKQAVALEPGRADLWFNLGEIAAGLNSEKVAMDSYRQALLLRPDFYRANLGLAGACVKFKQAEAAIPHFRKAIELQPGKSEAYRALAVVLARLKRYKVAAGVYQSWLEWDGENVSALNGYGLLLKTLGRTDQAVKKFEQALEISPNSIAVLNNLGTLLHLEGRLDEALAYFRRALKLDPANNLLKTHLAHTLLELGEVDEAATLNQALVDGRSRDASG